MQTKWGKETNLPAGRQAGIMTGPPCQSRTLEVCIICLNTIRIATRSKLGENVIEERFIEELPERLITDKAYDSDPLDLALQQQCIEMIARHMGATERKEPRTARN